MPEASDSTGGTSTTQLLVETYSRALAESESVRRCRSSIKCWQHRNSQNNHKSDTNRPGQSQQTAQVLLGSYTNAKLIDDSIRTIFDFGDAVEQVTETGYQNGKFDRRAERSLDPTDVSQRAVVSAVYELPFGPGKAWQASNRVVNAITSGWQVNNITTIQGGLPVILRGANNFRANRPNSTGMSAKLSDRTAARWFDTTAFVNPPNFTYGNLGRVLPDVRTPGVVNFDVSLVKNTRIYERARLEFRAEAFNIANHVNLGAPNATFAPGADGRNQSSTFGTIQSSRDARIIQLGLKFTF